MTDEELAVQYAEPLGKQFDLPFLELAKGKVRAMAARIIRQRLKESPNERIHFKQSIVVPLIEVDSVECDPIGECILRTKDKIPKVARTGVLFDYVGSPDFRNSFGVANPLTIQYAAYEKYGASKPKVVLRNDYVYVYFKKDLEKLGIESIFEISQDTLCSGKEKKICEDDLNYYPNDIGQQILEALQALDMKTQQRELPKNEQVETVKI